MKMGRITNLIKFICFSCYLFSSTAYSNIDWLCEKLKIDSCNKRQYKRSSGASIPSESNVYRLNPSAIPTEKGIGGEMVTWRGIYDYGIVTGTGKIGAAVSPTNMIDTFFANMSIENVVEYVQRKRERKTYESKKYTLATSTDIVKEKLNLIRPAIGLIAKYGRGSKIFHPGAGLSLGLGPFNIGYALNKDDYYSTILQQSFKFTTETFTFGVKIPYLAVDYSTVKNKDLPGVDDATITILSTTLFWKSFMLTYASRKEVSYRPLYNYELDIGETVQEKREGFWGLQYSHKGKFLVGLFNNYFLYREWSIGFTMFF